MGEDADRERKEGGKKGEREAEGTEEEKKEGGGKGKWEEGRETRLLQWIRNIMLDMCIDKADTTTQTIIQCAACCRCSAISPVHCMLHEI